MELHRATYHATRSALISLLEREGITRAAAAALANHWLHQADFLLWPAAGVFDFVVGNPPYVRQELIPAALLAEYRRRYPTLYDRADLYIPFVERSLALLAPGGSLGFICADRWMKNRYGGPLRRLIAGHYRLKIYVDMVDTPAFHSEVIAYPAITIISREPAGPTRVAYRPAIDAATLTTLAGLLTAPHLPAQPDGVRELPTVMNGSEPWLLASADRLAVIRHLEQRFPPLEDAGCSVGIGVATGADQAFIGHYDALDVEPDRKLPLAMTADVASGEVRWRGLGVINPFADDGQLVDLADYPRLRRYLETRRAALTARHCARKSPAAWYRTIDRIDARLASLPKLLIPDIKGAAHVVFEPGQLYPHHNLYYITSDQWDLVALQAVLLSDIAGQVIRAYSTRMRGGFLRFQAQYLRRLRIPHWVDVPADVRRALIQAATARDQAACNQAARQLYGLDYVEFSELTGLRGFVTSLAGHIAAQAARLG